MQRQAAKRVGDELVDERQLKKQRLEQVRLISNEFYNNGRRIVRAHVEARNMRNKRKLAFFWCWEQLRRDDLKNLLKVLPFEIVHQILGFYLPIACPVIELPAQIDPQILYFERERIMGAIEEAKLYVTSPPRGATSAVQVVSPDGRRTMTVEGVSRHENMVSILNACFRLNLSEWFSVSSSHTQIRLGEMDVSTSDSLDSVGYQEGQNFVVALRAYPLPPLQKEQKAWEILYACFQRFMALVDYDAGKSS